jgi:hypothetical protein
MNVDPYTASDLLDALYLVAGSAGSVADMLTGASANGETVAVGTAAAVGGGAVDVSLAEALIANAMTVTGDVIGGAATVAADTAAAASNMFPFATGIAAVTSALSSYEKELEPQVEEWLQETAKVADTTARNLSSFMSVASWPRQNIFTFGECAFRGKVPDEQLHLQGARVVIPTDPVPNLIGQAVGYRHSRMVPVLEIEEQGSNTSDEYDSAIADLTGMKVPAYDSDAPRLDAAAPEDVLSDLKRYGPNIFTDSDWGSHDLTLYASRLKHYLVQSKDKRERQKYLQTYRMAKLTSMMSYIDANISNVEAALEKLNAERDPINPDRLLFPDKLDHVITFPFYTPCDIVSRALHPLGDLLGPQAPISREGIAHNVHLLKDSANNGYLTFQGTTNLGTWVDVNFAFQKYDPKMPQIPFDSVVDDKRWALIEGHYLQNCHTGFCNTLKAFLSNKRFPLLAQEVKRMKSVTLLGHSFGGSLANMLARSVRGAKILRKQEGVIGRVRRLLRFRRRRTSDYSPR